MSGSGGGGGGAYDGSSVSCEQLAFETQLSSPKESVVALLKVGEFLPVANQTIGTTSVIVVLHQGQIAGGLASPVVQRLRQCITWGYVFKAEVKAINGGQVRLRVSGA